MQRKHSFPVELCEAAQSVFSALDQDGLMSVEEISAETLLPEDIVHSALKEMEDDYVKRIGDRWAVLSDTGGDEITL